MPGSIPSMTNLIRNEDDHRDYYLLFYIAVVTFFAEIVYRLLKIINGFFQPATNLNDDSFWLLAAGPVQPAQLSLNIRGGT